MGTLLAIYMNKYMRWLVFCYSVQEILYLVFLVHFGDKYPPATPSSRITRNQNPYSNCQPVVDTEQVFLCQGMFEGDVTVFKCGDMPVRMEMFQKLIGSFLVKLHFLYPLLLTFTNPTKSRPIPPTRQGRRPLSMVTGTHSHSVNDLLDSTLS